MPGPVFLKSDQVTLHPATEDDVPFLLDEWGNGYATAASRLLLDHAFGRLGLHKVRAKAFDTNPASHRVLEKLGFSEEGREREAAYADDQWVDFVSFGLLESEWRDGA